MEELGAAVLGSVFAIVVVAGGAVAVVGLAVWFGLYIVAPRIQRALDRAEADEEETGDRSD